ncbi:MAG: VWA domain-containing protein [Elusimicrobiales bacterium]|nr:VWA domain-containing protein [Elusimicrobiales bacterium]
MELFRYPQSLAWAAAALAALLVFRFRAEQNRAATARRVLGPAWERLAAGPAAARRRLRGLLFLLALALGALAAAGPQWGVELTPVTDLKGNVVIAVDTSLSMAARDMKPSRLENARLLLGAIAENFADYRIGVVAFSGEAYVQCPLTTDQEAVTYFASSLTPGMLPAPGTDFSAAIETTLGMLSRYGGQKVMVLITDGEDHSTVLDTALKEAEAQNLKIFTIGIGTPDGELIPMLDSAGNTMEYKKDNSGKTVVSRLGEAQLMKVASRTGAAYLRYSGPDTAAADVRRAVDGLDLEKSRGKGGAGFKNRYQWPLAAALLLLLIELLVMEKGFSLRWRWLRRAPAAAVLALLLPGTLAAESAAALARKGNSAYARQDWPKAFEYYSRAQQKAPGDKRLDFNTGDAFYRMEDYAKAREFFEQAATDPRLAARASYNRGNALYRAGDLQGAITSYRAALSLDPKDENARFNLQKALEQKKKNSCSDPKDDKKDKDKKEQQKKDQEKKDQDKKDQQKKEEQKEQEKKSEQEKKKAEARQKTRQILEMMKEKEKAAARGQDPSQQALRQAGKPPPRPRMEDW